MFICISGIDGSGKTSTAAALVDILQQEGHSAIFVKHNSTQTRRPYANAQLQNLRKIQLQGLESPYNELPDLHWILLRGSYYAIIDHHVVIPALRAGDAVVADGWFYKFAARMASNGAHSMHEVLKHFDQVSDADHKFLLDVPPKVAATRLGTFNAGELGPKNIGTTSPMEAFVEYQSEVRENLINFAREDKWTIISEPDACASDIAADLYRHLKKSIR
ncbi:dTMP kinase [Streptomyces umbrinus]|uniref:Thymidylate kinase n=1 Tax=Streptomyces umbrinus TaxID=67370 RepID=A0ABU0SN77_9ACTN|nr:hypothetical protein [Streptomyces umbrinus]MDQ1024742.1 dTMP kinase [Streptomyces umbrinus]